MNKNSVKNQFQSPWKYYHKPYFKWYLNQIIQKSYHGDNHNESFKFIYCMYLHDNTDRNRYSQQYWRSEIWIYHENKVITHFNESQSV